MSKTEKDTIRREKLTIYLAKDDDVKNEDLIDMEKVRTPFSLEAKGCRIDLCGKNYVRRSFPEWSKFLTGTNINSDKELMKHINPKQSTGALLIVRAHKKTFVINFGASAHIINSDAIERDFGLRVTLNSVDPEKLNSLDKASYNHNPLNSRNQSAQDADIFDLSIDSESDLVYAVTGKSTIEDFGPQVTGRDALIINPRVTLDTLESILAIVLEQYNKTLPQAFAWIDNIQKVRDSDEVSELEKELDALLVMNPVNDSLYLGEPEIVDREDQIGYSFDLRPKTERHIILQLSTLREYFIKNNIDFNCAELKKKHVHVNNNNYESCRSWSAFRCLYAEVTFKGKQYILKNGIWYRIEDSFVNKINTQLAHVQSYVHALPVYDHDSEGLYNESVYQSDKSIYTNMDAKNLTFGGAYSKIEFCDLIRDKTDFIHVKYYRGSNTLSHLFSQGVVSAEAFVSDREFREKLNTKLPIALQLADIVSRPNAKEYNVVYAIATDKKAINDLPFFSKVTLKNAVRSLEGLGFNVYVSFIDVSPAVLLKKKCKPVKAKGDKKIKQAA